MTNIPSNQKAANSGINRPIMGHYLTNKKWVFWACIFLVTMCKWLNCLCWETDVRLLYVTERWVWDHWFVAGDGEPSQTKLWWWRNWITVEREREREIQQTFFNKPFLPCHNLQISSSQRDSTNLFLLVILAAILMVFWERACMCLLDGELKWDHNLWWLESKLLQTVPIGFSPIKKLSLGPLYCYRRKWAFGPLSF